MKLREAAMALKISQNAQFQQLHADSATWFEIYKEYISSRIVTELAKTRRPMQARLNFVIINIQYEDLPAVGGATFQSRSKPLTFFKGWWNPSTESYTFFETGLISLTHQLDEHFKKTENIRVTDISDPSRSKKFVLRVTSDHEN